jgi:hypothetical protein
LCASALRALPGNGRHTSRPGLFGSTWARGRRDFSGDRLLCSYVVFLPAILDGARPSRAHFGNRGVRFFAELDEQSRGHQTSATKPATTVNRHFFAGAQALPNVRTSHGPRRFPSSVRYVTVDDWQDIVNDAAGNGFANALYLIRLEFVVFHQGGAQDSDKTYDSRAAQSYKSIASRHHPAQLIDGQTRNTQNLTR